MVRSFKDDYIHGQTASPTSLNPYLTSKLVNQNGHGFTAGYPVAMMDDGLYYGAISDSPPQIVQGIVAEVIDANNFLFAQYGRFTVTAHGLTIGETYYSDDTEGNLIPNPPVIYPPTSQAAWYAPCVYVEDANTLVARPTCWQYMWDISMLTGWVRIGTDENVYVMVHAPYDLEIMRIHYATASGTIEGTLVSGIEGMVGSFDHALFSTTDNTVSFSGDSTAHLAQDDWLRLEFTNNTLAYGIRWNIVIARRYS